MSASNVSRPLRSSLHQLTRLRHYTGGSNRTERVMGTKLTNARRLAMDTQSGGKQVHAIRIVGCTTGALMLVASGSVDLFQ